ncbi:glycosyltransferase 87 family protein [bacterium]|nr:glycosyltransferase 87 family protein [bacterium]
MKRKLSIFVLALLPRLFFGALFFGSVDLINSINNGMNTLLGVAIHAPYFPFIHAFIWLGAVINGLLDWFPLAFAYKLVPLFCDSLIAVLVFQILEQRGYEKAFLAGVLYAICPIPILIIGLHAQWDSITLLFLLLACSTRSFSQGIWFGLSVASKPYPLVFLPFLYRKNENRQALQALAGMAAILGVLGLVSWALGWDAQASFRNIRSYMNNNVAIFGFPMSELAGLFPTIENGRRIVLLALLACLPSLINREMPLTRRALFVLAGITASASLSPQYLIWTVPFLLVERYFRLAALFTGVTTVFLCLYYLNPQAPFVPYENGYTFLPLAAFWGLTPPGEWSQWLTLPLLEILGNSIIPTLLLGMTLMAFRDTASPEGKSPLPAKGYWVAFGTLALCLAMVFCLVDNDQVLSQAYANLSSKVKAYALLLPEEAHRMPVPVIAPPFRGSAFFNAVTLLGVLLVGYQWLSLRQHREKC